MADTADATVHAEDAHPHDSHGHGEHDIHMPPNSWIPLNIALSMTVFFVGFLTKSAGPVIWILGLLWFIATCVIWVRAAMSEYRETPD